MGIHTGCGPSSGFRAIVMVSTATGVGQPVTFRPGPSDWKKSRAPRSSDGSPPCRFERRGGAQSLEDRIHYLQTAGFTQGAHAFGIDVLAVHRCFVVGPADGADRHYIATWLSHPGYLFKPDPDAANVLQDLARDDQIERGGRKR